MISETRSRGTLAVALVVILNLIPVPYFSTRGIIFYKINFQVIEGALITVRLHLVIFLLDCLYAFFVSQINLSAFSV